MITNTIIASTKIVALCSKDVPDFPRQLPRALPD
jgi:hypothetical protein